MRYFFSLALLCGLGSMVWNASRERGLVVDAFSVPPELAQTGMTGSVVANRLIDKGLIHPTLSRVYPLTETGRATLDVHHNLHQGKVGVLCLAPSEGLGIRNPEKREKHLAAIGQAPKAAAKPKAKAKVPKVKANATPKPRMAGKPRRAPAPPRISARNRPLTAGG